MSPRRELFLFATTLTIWVGCFFAESLFGGKVLSSADVVLVTSSFADHRGVNYEPKNRLLMDPVLQFQPWLEFNRAMIRSGHLPLWNPWSGCGAPHLANAQSAVFDPFNAIAYVGTLPEAYGWMAAARLWTAGLGMFLLARSWGLGPWGRWFVGLSFPLCGFLVVWLLYPVTNVAVWMPWLLLATDRVLSTPSLRSLGWLALVTGVVLLGGHIQTSAHVLLATALYALWRWWSEPRAPFFWRRVFFWGLGLSLGLVVAAVEIVPFAFYLTKSPVWEDRERVRKSPWEFSRPRWLDSACVAMPYAFGSQRAGHPHIGRALGVHNLNESAGGFAGLAPLLWLAPLAWSVRRQVPQVGFLALLGGIGALSATGLPPVDNVLRALPVLNVTDNRRLSLWVAFALVMLGGIGLDRLAERRRYRVPTWIWCLGALALIGAGLGVKSLEPKLRHRAEAHYRQAAQEQPGADLKVYQRRAEHQVDLTLRFFPRYFGLVAGHLLILAVLAELWRRGHLPTAAVQLALLGLTLADLFGFGFGLNPAIPRADDRVQSPLIAFLRKHVPETSRIVGVGEELPPNTLMRYGLRDVRNYDSVELLRNLEWFASLYEGKDIRRDSRRTVTWESAFRSRDRLREASVAAIVGASPPPPSSFSNVHQVGAVWVALLDSPPWITTESGDRLSSVKCDGNLICLENRFENTQKIIIRETYDPSWQAKLDGSPLEIKPYRGTFLTVTVPSGKHQLVLRYDPPEVRCSLGASIFGLLAVVFTLTAPRPFRSTRIIASGLGRTQAAELESVLSSSPA